MIANKEYLQLFKLSEANLTSNSSPQTSFEFSRPFEIDIKLPIVLINICKFLLLGQLDSRTFIFHFFYQIT